jgi:glutamate 5-kinase|tara:strand:+ start:148 stop:1290 length:1143 start_codon:yes stop_codon:yes gene_type:complete
MTEHKRILVKIGTQLITNKNKNIDESIIEKIVDQVSILIKKNIQVLIVTSGAVASGKSILKTQKSDLRISKKTLTYKQTLASLGQAPLIGLYSKYFQKHNLIVGQALISRSDLQNRLGYLNIRNTLENLMNQKAVPIINENDVVSVDELEGEIYGDNDRLSAMIANAIDADLLILLGDIEGIFTSDPKFNKDAKLINSIEEINNEIINISGDSSDNVGSGGMKSKIEAASLATKSGAKVVIASGKLDNVIIKIIEGQNIGTTINGSGKKLESKKRWLSTGIYESKGMLIVDEGAKKAILEKGASLLPAGILNIEGDFNRGDIISIKSKLVSTFAWGISNYSSNDIKLIKGKDSKNITELINKKYEPEIIHRDNLVISRES